MTPSGRPTTGRRRDTPRSRGASRASERAARARSSARAPRGTDKPASSESQRTATSKQRVAAHAAPRHGLAVTRRAVAVLAVAFVLLFSYLNSLRVYFGQQQDMERAREAIASEKAQIDTLKDEKKRWEDPDYVKAQARIRLGWVVPGEVGYKVIGADGKPLGGGSELDARRPGTDARRTIWWQRLLGSVKAADDPVPTQANPTKPRPTELKYVPSPTPTPSR